VSKLGGKSRRRFLMQAAAFGFASIGNFAWAAAGQGAGFREGLIESILSNRTLTRFYAENSYAPVWIGSGELPRARLVALLGALETSADHGLPAYGLGALLAELSSAPSQRALGRIEGMLSQVFLDYARDIQTGVLTPSQIDENIARKVPLRDPLETMRNFMGASPATFLRALPPQSPEYNRLMKHKMLMEQVISAGGWAPKVPLRKLKPGDSGAAVIALRDRLTSMGYLHRSASPIYDVAIEQAVRAFQSDHGLAVDGVAGKGTISAMNVSAQRRLASIIVAMERERWINKPLGERHVWVNLADFSAAIVDDGKITFKTRAVVGANVKDRRSPEFSDMMEHMIINPTWNVPRSIAVKEYLPKMQEDPQAVSYLRLIDESGNEITRDGIDFTQFTEEDFPFDLKQPPSQGNALGLVKFMFPNKFNIYLHDTPEKHLFSRASRAFSHGCIRLREPFKFAYELLRPQTSDPVGFFQAKLATHVEQLVPLETPIPVHLVYRTAFTSVRGGIQFRRDIYGRDARIFAALKTAGVAQGGVRS